MFRDRSALRSLSSRQSAGLDDWSRTISLPRPGSAAVVARADRKRLAPVGVWHRPARCRPVRLRQEGGQHGSRKTVFHRMLAVLGVPFAARKRCFPESPARACRLDENGTPTARQTNCGRRTPLSSRPRAHSGEVEKFSLEHGRRQLEQNVVFFLVPVIRAESRRAFGNPAVRAARLLFSSEDFAEPGRLPAAHTGNRHNQHKRQHGSFHRLVLYIFSSHKAAQMTASVSR